MPEDTGKLLTDLADLAVELVKGVEPPRLSIYLQSLGKWLHTDNGFGESKEFLELCNKAQSMALKKIWGRGRDLKSEVLDYLDVTRCDVDITTLSRDLTIVTKQEKSRLRMILSRLVNDDKVLENTGRGRYRLIKGCEFTDWTVSKTNPVNLWLPFELSSPDFTVLTPGDIVLFMGTPNSGKTAVTMSIAKENRRNYNVYYFSTEITAAGFNRRMSKFSDCTVEQLNEIKFSDDFGEISDVIQPGKGNLNIIDYLEQYDNFYNIGEKIRGIHKKLKGAMCIINIQKDPGKEYGTGGNFTQMKPMLSVALDYPNIATITKMKEWNPDIPNPNRKIYHYKLIDGCRFTRKTPSVGWQHKNEGSTPHGI